VLSLTPRLEGHNKPITQAIDRALRTNPHKNEQEIYPTLGCDIYALERVDEVDSLAQKVEEEMRATIMIGWETCTPGSL
jgi:hypothetical protein